MLMMFKRFFLIYILLLAVAVTVGCSTPGTEPEPEPTPTPQELSEKLKALDGVTKVSKLSEGEFAEKFEVMLTQPLDGRNPAAGTFSQRVLVMHVGYDRPTILITEGYDAGGGLSRGYQDELSTLLDANIVMVEHRYFEKSTPKPLDWKYLTVENSAYDLHNIRTLFGKLYPEKWIATGISKGGTTTMIYAAYFPDEVDGYVPYVAPLCKSLEDSRFTTFMTEIGDAQTREAIKAFQIELFRRKASILPMLEELCESKNFTFRVPLSEIYEYWVLEYAFSFWQWGFTMRDIPALTASDGEMFRVMSALVDPGYYAVDYIYAPSFVQDAREMGYYPYDMEPFREYMTLTTTKDYLRRILLPEELRNEEFSTGFYEKVSGYLKNNDPRMIMIYGESDPWTAPGAAEFVTPDKRNMKLFVAPNGSHNTRISTLSPADRSEVMATLQGWLEN